jgi:acetylornithine deacetylase/succinyl-diaminopimelate desuccinylase-like protein
MQAEYPNVVATIGTGTPPVVVLNGHMDTVPPSRRDQWQTNPFEPTISNGRVYALGALDMKGSCAVMMLVLRAINEAFSSLEGTIQLQLVCDEEKNAFYGTPYLINLMEQGKLPTPDHVIVGEYTGLKVMTGERGSFKFLVHLLGQSTHTATARVEGKNAIYAAAEVIRLLERDLPIEHSDVGRAVISVNQIWGGSHPSQVPDRCTIQVDRRLIPGETMETVLRDATETIETLRENIPWLDFEVTPVLNDQGQPIYLPPNVSPRNIQSANAVRRNHERITGLPAEDFRGWFGATDARCFRYVGIDAINYGPEGNHAHGPNEFVIIDSLKTQLDVLAYSVIELCGEGLEIVDCREK